MEIALIEIEGFRGVRRGAVRLNKSSVLIGANNCGKTTVIEALALLLGRDRLIRSLTEHDFFGSDPQPADRIRIIATIAGFLSHDASHCPDWFRMGRGVEKWFNPTTGELTPERNNGADLLACQIALCARRALFGRRMDSQGRMDLSHHARAWLTKPYVRNAARPPSSPPIPGKNAPVPLPARPAGALLLAGARSPRVAWT